jgi:hypothetical protein
MHQEALEHEQQWPITPRTGRVASRDFERCLFWNAVARLELLLGKRDRER